MSVRYVVVSLLPLPRFLLLFAALQASGRTRWFGNLRPGWRRTALGESTARPCLRIVVIQIQGCFGTFDASLTNVVSWRMRPPDSAFEPVARWTERLSFVLQVLAYVDVLVAPDDPSERVGPEESLVGRRSKQQVVSRLGPEGERETPALVDLHLLLTSHGSHQDLLDLGVVEQLVLGLRVVGLVDSHPHLLVVESEVAFVLLSLEHALL